MPLSRCSSGRPSPCLGLPSLSPTKTSRSRRPGVSDEDFEVKTTRSLLNLCTVSTDDARYKEALHFCHGYLVGAYHYYLASVSGPSAKRLVCPPDPPPTRNAAITAFIAWAQAHPQYMSEAPVETEFRFLTETYPCKR